MLAHIIPLRRLPRDVETFDYSVPDELKDTIRPGQLVTIPFRKSDILGLVLTIHNTTTMSSPTTIGNDIGGDLALKPIKTIINESPLLSEAHIQMLLKLSRWYGVSLATMVKWSLPPLKKRKLASLQVGKFASWQAEAKDHRSHIIDHISLITCHQYTDRSEHANSLLSAMNGFTLVLVPLIHLIDEVVALLTPELQEQIIIWHGELLEREQFDRWVQIRNGAKKIIIGTRSAVFLPFPKLDRIIIDYEHDENHKHWDQAPRFHVKDVAPLLAELHDAELHIMSFSLSCEAYFHVAKGQWQVGKSTPLSDLQTCRLADPITLIDLGAERRAGRFGMVADEIKEAITDAKDDVFIYINRLGFATSADCQKCGYIFSCPECKLPLAYHEAKKNLICHYCRTVVALPRACPKCQSALIRMKGMGTEFVERGVRELHRSNDNNNLLLLAGEGRGMRYPAHGEADTLAPMTHSLIRIDSLSQPKFPDDHKARIVIGTNMALPYVRWDKTDLVVLLGLDQQLSIPEFRASENVWHLIQLIKYQITNTKCQANSKSQILIQTFHPDHIIFRCLTEPDRFYRTELNARKKVGYPPYHYLVRYFYGDSNQEKAKNEAQKLYVLLKKQLTISKIDAILSSAIEMQPRYFRGRYWYAVIAKLQPDTWRDDLVWINRLVPSAWKIDPNPISLLSP